MKEIKFTCHSCHKETSFNPQKTQIMLLDDVKERPTTYVPKCTHCGAQCSVTVKND